MNPQQDNQLTYPLDATSAAVIQAVIRDYLGTSLAPKSYTTSQRDLLSPGLNKLIIFNTTTSKLNFWDGSAWRAVTSA